MLILKVISQIQRVFELLFKGQAIMKIRTLKRMFVHLISSEPFATKLDVPVQLQHAACAAEYFACFENNQLRSRSS